jgi:four helix bundle protein
MAEMPYKLERIWQQADVFAQAIEALIDSRRLDNIPYIRDQLMRAAYSTAANIAEGRGRGSGPDYGGFIDYSRGSMSEAHYWELVLTRRKVLSSEEGQHLMTWAEGISLGIWTTRNGLRAANGRQVPPRRRKPEPEPDQSPNLPTSQPER